MSRHLFGRLFPVTPAASAGTFDPATAGKNGMPSLAYGAHRPGPQACLMEYCSVFSGLAWTDHPFSVHPGLAAIGRTLNDYTSGEARQKMLLLVPRLCQTGGKGYNNLSLGTLANEAAYNPTTDKLEQALVWLEQRMGIAPLPPLTVEQALQLQRDVESLEHNSSISKFYVSSF